MCINTVCNLRKGVRIPDYFLIAKACIPLTIYNENVTSDQLQNPHLTSYLCDLEWRRKLRPLTVCPGLLALAFILVFGPFQQMPEADHLP